MKRIVKILLLTAVIMALLATAAFAATYTNCADSLKELGLFKGSEKGYELDRAPTRLEAGVMLVRLLGQEDAAKALADNYTAPFTDVKPWAYGYVQYLYDNGLSKGQGGGRFGSDNPCTAQQYATFLLRALGYTDSGDKPDFTYANAISFATHKGVIDMFNCEEDNFLRDHMAAMSYTALATAPKTGEADLLTKLVADGAVADAKGYDKKFEALRAFDAVAATEVDQLSCKADMDMSVKAGGEALALKGAMDIQAVVDKANVDKSKMMYTLKLNMNGEEIEGAAYYTDGAVYMDMAGQKIKMALPIKEMVEGMGVDLFGSTEPESTPICLVGDVTATSKDGADTYTVSISADTLSTMLDQVIEIIMKNVVEPAASAAAEEQGVSSEELAAAIAQLNDMFKLTINKADTSVTVKDGAMTGLGIDFDIALNVADQEIAITFKMNLTDIKTEGVTVTLPTDLSSYVDMGELQTAAMIPDGAAPTEEAADEAEAAEAVAADAA